VLFVGDDVKNVCLDVSFENTQDWKVMWEERTGSRIAGGCYHQCTRNILQYGVLPFKRPEHVSDHSAPSSVEVKNGRAIPPLPHTSWYLID
jgi:hypothetical protein